MTESDHIKNTPTRVRSGDGTVVGWVVNGSKILDLVDPRTQQRRDLRARFSEKRLARWLAANLNTKLPYQFVTRYGAKRIVDALHQRIVERFEPWPELVERTKLTYPEGANVHAWLKQDGLVPCWRVDPELDNPGGMLRWWLENPNA